MPAFSGISRCSTQGPGEASSNQYKVGFGMKVIPLHVLLQ